MGHRVFHPVYYVFFMSESQIIGAMWVVMGFLIGVLIFNRYIYLFIIVCLSSHNYTMVKAEPPPELGSVNFTILIQSMSELDASPYIVLA